MSEQTRIAKPLGLVRKELQEGIVQLINESGLPLSMVAYILKDMLEQINATVVQQEEAEIAAYKAKLEASDSKE